MIIDPDEDEHPNWWLYFDGAVNVHGNGAGVVLISPRGDHYPVAVQLKFSCTNNMAEYEACSIGLQATLDMRIRDVEVYEDSILIISQVTGE